MDAFGSEEEIVSKMLAGFLAIVTASWTRPVHCVSIAAGVQTSTTAGSPKL